MLTPPSLDRLSGCPRQAFQHTLALTLDSHDGIFQSLPGALTMLTQRTLYRSGGPRPLSGAKMNLWTSGVCTVYLCVPLRVLAMDCGPPALFVA